MLHGKWAVKCNVVLSSSQTIQCKCPNGKKSNILKCNDAKMLQRNFAPRIRRQTG